MPWTVETAVEFLEQHLVNAAVHARNVADCEEGHPYPPMIGWWPGKAELLQQIIRTVPNISPVVLRDFVKALQTIEPERDGISDEETMLTGITVFLREKEAPLFRTAEDVCREFVKRTRVIYGGGDIPPRRCMS
jgi:hypothetical protein